MPCKGAVWQDLVMFAFTAEFQGGADADLLVRSPPLTRDIAESSIDVVGAGRLRSVPLAGPAAGGPLMPDSNAYHIACAEASLRWLQRRVAGRTNL